jgi:hypothetical protein
MDTSVNSQETMQFLERVERDLLEEIAMSLENDTLTPEVAQQMAKEFLSLLPIHDKIELLQHMKELSGKYEEIRHLYIKFGHEYNEENKSERLSRIAEHIRSNDLDSAIHVAKEGTINV